MRPSIEHRLDQTSKDRGENNGPTADQDQDARALIAKINESFTADGPKTAAQPAPATRSPRRFVSPLAKTCVALALAVAVGWTPLQRLISVSSSEATVNGRLVTLRAPIDGTIENWNGSLVVGQTLAPGMSVMTIRNVRADRARLDQLTETLHDKEDALTGLLRRRDQLDAEQARLSGRLDIYKTHFINVLKERRRELVAEIDAMQARGAEAATALERYTKLLQAGYQSQAKRDVALRDDKVAAAMKLALDHRLAVVDAQLDAAQQNVFVTNGDNDRPQTGQTLDVLEREKSLINSQILELRSRLVHAKTALEAEDKRYHERAEAEVRAPASGRVWEVLVSPGEEIQRGQPMLRTLDCAEGIVTAMVSETAFNKLWLGMPATFRMLGSNKDLAGTVIGLPGMGNAIANYAIAPAKISREPYQAIVDVPELSRGGECQIGRTGTVTFDASTSRQATPVQ